MKKVSLCLLIVLSLLFSSCGVKNDDNKNNKTSNSNVELGTFSKNDMILHLGDQTFNFGEDASKLLTFLGEPEEVVEILSCYYEGYDKTYKFKNIDVVTFPKDGKDILDEVLFYDNTYSFKGGVTVGSTKEEVIASYGDKFFMESDAMIYNITNDKNDNESPRLTFILKDNVVTTIDFFSSSYFS